MFFFRFCLKQSIKLDITWVPRSMNQHADSISKFIDSDDWGVTDSIFDFLDSLWGPYEIDFFASHTNTKLPVFYSRYWTPGCIGVDAFTVDWHGVNGWLVPPISLIARTIM